MTLLKTYDIQLKSIWLQKTIREKPKWALENGFEFNEQHHRWMNTDTGEVHEHPENTGKILSVLEYDSLLEGISEQHQQVQLKENRITDVPSYLDIGQKYRKIYCTKICRVICRGRM